MRIPRIYCGHKLQPGMEVSLHSSASRHILHVLRLKLGAPIILFNGQGGEYKAVLTQVKKLTVVAEAREFVAIERESPLIIHLGQAISCGEKMDFTIQKAVELGINRITPLFTERCEVRLHGERLEKKQQHWQAIAISACEQCGRNKIPQVERAKKFSEWLSDQDEALKLVLLPNATYSSAELTAPAKKIRLLVGSEGGLSEKEGELAEKHRYLPISLGPRILRTETAALVAVSILQAKWGDI